MSALSARLAAVLDRREVQVLGALLFVQMLTFWAYVLVVPGTVLEPRFAFYGLVWINAGVYAVLVVDVPEAPLRRKAVATAVAGAYLLVLLYLSGLIDVYPGGTPANAAGISTSVATPGWETVSVVGEHFHVTFVTHLFVGYIALSYLVYVTILDAANAAVSGVLGLFSCVGCTFPIAVSLASGLVGSGAGLTRAIFDYSMDISLLVYLLALALLYWRPGFGWRPGFDRFGTRRE